MKDLLGRSDAVTVEQAIAMLIDQEIAKLDVERIPLEAACGRVVAQDIISPDNLPGFDRSTMDGYAVNSADTFGASDTMPAYLRIIGEVLMGKKTSVRMQRGEACQIPTGGMLPEGADAVVMFEYTSVVDGEMVEIMRNVSPGENVIRFDEDVRKGDTVLRSGHRLRPQDIGALAGIGVLEAPVYRKPVVAIISTGDEVVSPERSLSPGEVRDINSYNLAGMISDCRSVALRMGIVKDSMDVLKESVRSALDRSDMVLITGGSSVGTSDHTAKVINELGSPGVLFHGVAMKPGKPLIGGMVGNKPVFGLPGHPAAVTVCFETFIEPLLIKLSGEKRESNLPARRIIRALFGRNLSSVMGREEHVRVTVERRNGAMWAVPVLGKSGLIRTLVKADGIVVVPMNKSGVYEGEEVEVRLFK